MAVKTPLNEITIVTSVWVLSAWPVGAVGGDEPSAKHGAV